MTPSQWSALACLPVALVAVICPVSAQSPVSVQSGGKEGSWHVELESRADSADKGKVTYRLAAAQGLVQPPSKPVLTTSAETLTYAPTPGGGPRVMVIKYLSCDAMFQVPNLTCDSVTLRLLPPSGTQEIAAKPIFHFRQDFLASGFAFGLSVPRGFHYVSGSAHPSRMSGLPPNKPRAFVKPPQYALIADKGNPHLLSVLLPAPEPRAVGSGFEAPYGIEFALASD